MKTNKNTSRFLTFPLSDEVKLDIETANNKLVLALRLLDAGNSKKEELLVHLIVDALKKLPINNTSDYD